PGFNKELNRMPNVTCPSFLHFAAQVPDSDEQFVPDFHSENCGGKESVYPPKLMLTHFSRQDPNFVNPSGPPQAASSQAYLMEHSSYQLHPETGQPFSASQASAPNTSSTYQRPFSAPCLPYPPQGFKQEFHDPMYEQANTLGTTGSSQYTAGVVIKQEQMDYAFETDVPSCHSMYMNTEGFPGHSNPDGTLGEQTHSRMIIR
ncbi:hypothetical protein JD844_001873, partial [Phrynosoma platyrhinos]